MDRTILFEHIPKTGGITLRGILVKVYGEKNVFVINSNDPGSSLEKYKMMDEQARQGIRVITGHGASLYQTYLENPFKITILRNPVSLFFSQFYYLKVSKKDTFWKDVNKMQSPEEYHDYALSMGQDNLMTRFLANSMAWTVDPQKSFHDMNLEGEKLLQQAKANLMQFDAVLDLNRFDDGIYALSKMLNWKSIPIYKPSNRNLKKPTRDEPDGLFLKKLNQVLRFDVELYDYFLKKNLDSASKTNPRSVSMKLFKSRQHLLKSVAKVLGKN
jgi:hypothetical protein